MPDRQLQHPVEDALQAFRDVASHDFDLALRKLDRVHGSFAGRGLQRVVIQPHRGTSDANFLFGILLQELQKGQHRRNGGLDADFLDLSGRFGADRGTDSRVEHVVEVDEGVVDGKAAVVRQVGVIDSRAHERRHRVLFALRDVEDGLAEDGIWLWVDGDKAKRNLVGLVVVQKLVIAAAKPETIELRDAGSVQIVASVALCDQDEPHHAVHRRRFFDFGVSTAVLRLTSPGVKFRVNGVEAVQHVVVQTHRNGVTDPHLAAVPDNAEVIGARGVLVDEKLFERHVFDANRTVFRKHRHFGVEQRDLRPVRRDHKRRCLGRLDFHDLDVAARYKAL